VRNASDDVVLGARRNIHATLEVSEEARERHQPWWLCIAEEIKDAGLPRGTAWDPSAPHPCALVPGAFVFNGSCPLPYGKLLSADCDSATAACLPACRE
jgi:hypothetical protein